MYKQKLFKIMISFGKKNTDICMLFWFQASTNKESAIGFQICFDTIFLNKVGKENQEKALAKSKAITLNFKFDFIYEEIHQTS